MNFATIGALAERMTTYAKDAPRLDKVILIIACALAALVVAQMAFWESRQQDTMDRLADIMVMQQSQLARLEEMSRANRRDIDRGR